MDKFPLHVSTPSDFRVVQCEANLAKSRPSQWMDYAANLPVDLVNENLWFLADPFANTMTLGNDLFWNTLAPLKPLDHEPIYTPDLIPKNFTASRPQSTASTSQFTDHSPIDWDLMMQEDISLDQQSFESDLNDSEDQEDWAWMESASLIPPQSTQSSSNFELSIKAIGSDDRSDQEKTLNTDRKVRCRKKAKECHNAIERKYRENINTRLAEIDQWLSDHQSTGYEACKKQSKRTTKGHILTSTLERLDYLSRYNAQLEKQRQRQKMQIASLKRLVVMQRKQLALVSDTSRPKTGG